MREKITTALKTHKITITEKNKLLAQKGKEIKIENEYISNLQKQSIDERNRNICYAIKSQEKGFLERKKREDVLMFNNT